MTTPMMDKGKRKKIDQDSSEDDDTSWVDTWFDTWRESLVSQSSQTVGLLVPPSRLNAITDTDLRRNIPQAPVLRAPRSPTTRVQPQHLREAAAHVNRVAMVGPSRRSRTRTTFSLRLVSIVMSRRGQAIKRWLGCNNAIVDPNKTGGVRS